MWTCWRNHFQVFPMPAQHWTTLNQCLASNDGWHHYWRPSHHMDRSVHQTWNQCWFNAEPALAGGGPALNQHWINKRASTTQWSNAGWMLGGRRRRRSSFKSTLVRPLYGTMSFWALWTHEFVTRAQGHYMMNASGQSAPFITAASILIVHFNALQGDLDRLWSSWHLILTDRLHTRYV